MPKTGHTIRVVTDRLSQPVGRLMRPCVSIDSATSIRIAIEQMREAGQEVLPVTVNDALVGILGQDGILKFVGTGRSDDEPVTRFLRPASKILNHATGADALRLLEEDDHLVVVDDHDVVCGMMTAACFVGTRPEPERPALVGGMATPFGVYLTSGIVGGGKGGWYLVSTGMLLISMVIIGNLVASILGGSLPNASWVPSLLEIIAIVPLLLVFRFHPIAGYHAAEHQVVHAIEQGEPLTVEVVKRMPRVHPRCGTNIAVAASLFYAISHVSWIPDGELRYFLAVLLTLFFWRRLGSLVQYWITTRKPNAKQIESGIQAAKELMENYQVAPNRTATPLTRIWSSGILHVMAGSFLALGIAALIQMLFKIELL